MYVYIPHMVLTLIFLILKFVRKHPRNASLTNYNKQPECLLQYYRI